MPARPKSHRPLATYDRPAGLQPALGPLTMVCGAPCSGKSAYVAEHAQPGDLIIDLDIIASTLARSGLHNWDRRWLPDAMALRNGVLRSLAERRVQAWFILCCPDDRDWWYSQLQPRVVLLLLPSVQVCLERARRRQRYDTMYAVRNWYLRYRPAACDTISSVLHAP